VALSPMRPAVDSRMVPVGGRGQGSRLLVDSGRSAVNLFDFDQRLPEVLSELSPEATTELLRVLSLPDAERARTIGELHQRSGGAAMAELLIDLEEGPESEQLRACVRNELRRIEHES
jgi:hypothetical protein